MTLLLGRNFSIFLGLMTLIFVIGCHRKALPKIDENVISETEEIQDTTGQASNPSDTDMIILPLPDTIIWYSRSGCFGQCPVYSFLLLTDTTAVYNGRKYVDQVGNFTLDLTDSTFLEFSQFIETFEYMEYAENHPENEEEWIVDLPTSTMIFKGQDGEKKIIRINHSPPEKLKAFETELRQYIHALNWSAH